MSIGAHHRIRGYDIDTEAIYRGAFVVTVLAVPLAAVAGRALSDGSGWQVVVTIAIFAAFAAGGAVSGHMRPETPALHGALASLPCLIVLAAVRAVLAFAGDADFDPIVVLAMFASGTTLGLIGGVAASRLGDRTRSVLH
ncbi:MAG: hypothetical protein GY708_16595 [Actinomycetia bacterium]|nr:hypothetical protein [Actinomycetes bacterium]MCP4959698.1 hypothetical protein [Actinomycetes bacterium]